MIFVKRTRIPKVLEKEAGLWLTKLGEVFLEFNKVQSDLRATKEQKRVAKKKLDDAQGKYNHKEVKSALVEMFYGKCAYCESKITVVTYGHIEHFYPKSLPTFINKTFEWNNFLLSCDICNNSQHKGTQFPIDSTGEPLLLDPTKTNPATHFDFVWDTMAGAIIHGIDPQGQTTETIFDLNGLKGRKELIRERTKHVKTLLILLKFAQNGDHEALDLLKEACQPDASYLAFTQIYIAPELAKLSKAS